MSRQLINISRFFLLVLGVTAVLTLTVHAAPTTQQTSRPRFNLEEIPHQPDSHDEQPTDSALAVTAPDALLPWSKVTFQSLRNGNWDIFVGNDDGSGQTAVAKTGYAEVHPHLNRGNTKIVYAVNNGGGYEIYTVNIDGSGKTALTNNGTNDVNPSWSPDGSKIVFEAYRNGEADIYVMNANGSNQVRLTTHPDFDGMPTWSPDGSKIAFVSRRTGGYRIYVMNADGSGQTQISSQAYSFRPQWSPDGSQIAYDADSDGDGWQDLWRMNADGTSQALVYNPSGQTDAWASSWSPDGSRIVYTLISFVYYQGNWYWTYAYPDAWGPNLGTTRLSSNGLDWDASWQTSDNSSPGLTLSSVPLYSRNPLALSWTGTDVGSAGIKNYDVQYRAMGATNWSNLAVSTTATVANFNGTTGQTYQFRLRAVDKAFNYSTWQYNYKTTMYSWLISGNIMDNRGNPITNATVNTTPASFEASSSNFQGFFQNFVGETPNSYSASLFKSGYSTLPTTSYMSTEDAFVRMALPPNDNILTNWGFEDGPFGPSNWQTLGLLTERTATEKHTGSYSAFMGEATTPQPLNISTTTYGASFSPNVTSTEDGKIHIIWLEDDLTGICRVMYRNINTNGTVSAVEGISGTGDHCYYNSIVADTNGVLHVSWLQLIQGDYHVYYRQRDNMGNWSSIEDVSLNNSGSAQPHLKIRDTGEVYLVWNDRQNNEEVLFFSEREGVSNWSTPLNISPGLTSTKTFDIDVDHLGGVHVLWRELDYLHYYEASILATYRSSSGTWSAPTVVAGPDGHKGVPDFAVDSTGKVHAVWSNIDPTSQYQVYYSSRNLDGTWTVPTQLSIDGLSNGIALITAGFDGKLYVLWQEDNGFRYITRSTNGTWGTIQPIPSINNPPVIFEVDQMGILHLAWRDQDSNMGKLIYAFQSNDNWSMPLNISGTDSEVGVTDSFLASDSSVSFAWATSTEELDYIGEIFSVRAKPGAYTLSQTVDIPGSMINPTLSLFAKPVAGESGNYPILSVNIDDGISNQSFSLTDVNDPSWSHYWIDLSPWLGESIQIDVSYEIASTAPFEAASPTQLNGFYLDEITLGSSFTDLWIQIDGTNEALRGDEVTYTVTYGNSSSIDADDISITAVLPPQLTFLSASLPPSSQSPTLTWNVGDLPANSGTQSFTITARVKNSAEGLTYANSTVNVSTATTELETINNVSQSSLFIGTSLHMPVIMKN